MNGFIRRKNSFHRVCQMEIVKRRNGMQQRVNFIQSLGVFGEFWNLMLLELGTRNIRGNKPL